MIEIDKISHYFITDWQIFKQLLRSLSGESGPTSTGRQPRFYNLQTAAENASEEYLPFLPVAHLSCNLNHKKPGRGPGGF